MDLLNRFKIEILVTVAILGVIFTDSSMAFGRAVGLANFALLFALLIFSVLFCAHLMSRFNFSKNRVAFAGVLFVCSATLHTVLLVALDDAFDLDRSFATERIIYHCETRFDQRKCALEVNLCPSCVDSIGGIRRDQMASRLKAYRVYYSRIPKNRSVASSNNIKPR